ncbi:MAG: Crp/Fnr family transcriptional regulator [Actinobacteria bacterium]|nr:MAG: Crp/Fnr family transcriptional regulator [Actinomycetota bacterium]
MDSFPVPLPLHTGRRGPPGFPPFGGLGRRHRLEAGQVLLSEGQPPPAIYALEAGALSLAVTQASGHRIVLGVLGPGDLFGEQALLDRVDANGSTRGVGPLLPECRAMMASQVLDLNWREVADASSRDAELATWLATSLARRVSDLHRSLTRALSLRLPERTLDLLVALARNWGRSSASGGGIEVPLTQEDLAAMLGATRESVNRAVRRLERSGAIARSGRSYVVLPGGSERANWSP